jgi:hypothetical protein
MAVNVTSVRRRAHPAAGTEGGSDTAAEDVSVRFGEKAALAGVMPGGSWTAGHRPAEWIGEEHATGDRWSPAT